MDMPTAETPADAYLPRSAYTISRAAADPKIAGREQALNTAHEALKAALRERDDLREQVQKKSALLDAADDACDSDIEAFQLFLLAALEKNRDHLKYKRYFADGLRAVTQAEPRKEEPEIVADMLERMTEDANDAEIGTAVNTWRPKLETSQANVVAADESLRVVEKTLSHLEEKKLPALMASWREEYKKLEAALITVYPSDAKRVSRFFKPFRKNRKISKPKTPVTPPVTP